MKLSSLHTSLITKLTFNCIQQSLKTTLKFCVHSIVCFVFFVFPCHGNCLDNFSHSNLTDRHIKSLEFNVLDSLNTKLVRPVSIASCDYKKNFTETKPRSRGPLKRILFTTKTVYTPAIIVGLT